MSSFAKLKVRLREEGWYLGWNHYCCQSCAWMDVPDYHDARYDDNGYLVHPETGKELDYMDRDDVYEEISLSKVLFNHSQDCEVYFENECEACDGEGYDEDDDDCETCNGTGMVPDEDFNIADYDTSQPGFVCHTPEQLKESLFCFDGQKEGVKNLKAILPIIKECGCDYHWDETGESRISISWD